MAIDAASGGELEMSFSTTESELRVEGRAPVAAGVDVAVESLTAQILKAVIDDYDLHVEDGYVRFSCVTRRPLL
jgi:hypothetical protein